MKDSNYGRNELINNPMYGRTHSEQTKEKMSKTQSLRMDEIRKIVYGTRSDQLDDKIRRIVRELLLKEQ